MSPEKAPTMIIPSGTDIEVDVHGQLTVRTPGNLVLQDSGNFATLESIHGSIRIEANAEVEAVNVRCAETCFIEGVLTAWRVTAESIHLEESARANIVLQETSRLEVGRGARLVGNFKDDRELFYLFSRFASELRALPIFSDRHRLADRSEERETESDLAQSLLAASRRPEEGPDPGRGEEIRPLDGTAGSGDEDAVASEVEALPDPLFFSLVILERELARPAYGPISRRAIEELVKLLRARDFETLRLTYRTLFGRIVDPGKDARRVEDLLGKHFRISDESAVEASS